MAALIEAIAFDLDGTLIDRTQAVGRYWKHVAQAFPMISDKLEHLIGIDDGEPSCAVHIRRYLAESGLTKSDPMLADRINDTLPNRIADHLKKDAAIQRMLERLSSSFKTAVITNGRPRTQRSKLERSGLRSAMDCIVISGEAGVSKPDATIFRIAAARLGIELHQILMVGDDPQRDILGASAVGMRTALLRNHHGSPPPIEADLYLESVLELERAISCLMQER